MYLQLDGEGPTYERLARAIQAAIREGRIAAGAKLPPSRELASRLKVSRNTVVGAYELLCSQQWARSRHGSGTYVLRVPGKTARIRDGDSIPPPSRYSTRLRNAPQSGPGARIPQVRYDLQYGDPVVNPTLASMWRPHLLRAVRETTLSYPPVQGSLA
jgi:GntR family transcriptional regulator/MocR family aminotransferase